ncbi:MAG TPA: reverse transcriptase-like protein [Candidatus Deferrimicrobiaceae bacterium]|nr:reverse transcriptase-like protein [Candidatus Deferrimicrobiaceae bacterium]
MSQRLQIYSDGGARGNPGLAAIAFLALNERGETVKADKRFIGVRTNNQAEYEALLLALNYAAEHKAQEVICHLDSELVARQLRGEYAVKNAELQRLWRKVQELKGNFKKINFINVPRENLNIQRADALVNETLDAQEGKRTQMGLEENGGKCVFIHASIRTSSMDRSIDFYNRLLGLKLLSRREIKATNAEIAFLQDAEGKGCKLELTYYHNQTKFSQPEYEERLFDHLGFEVKDIKKTIDSLRRENVTITDEPFEFNEHTTIAFIEDPDGTLIELIQRK